MKMVCIVILLLAVVVALILQSTALSRRTSFTGSILLTVALGTLLWINHANYLVVALSFFMLLADISIYFFGRSIALFPPRENAPPQITKIYRAAVIFFLSCWVLGLAAIIWRNDSDARPAAGAGDAALQGLHQMLWTDGFLFVAVAAILVLVCSFGVFFMAKKES